MTPSRFVECLEALHWSNDQLAAIMECDEGRVEAWAIGLEPIPAKVAAWVETLAKAHEALEGDKPKLRKRKAGPPTEH
jgi:hypothetical protein